MSVQAMTRVLENSRLSGAARMVLLVIANHETEDRGAYPSIERIAKEANVSVRTVFRAVEEARLRGELLVAFKAGPNGTNLYRVLPNETMPLWHRDIDGPQMSPELKELGVRGSTTASASGSTQRKTYALEAFERAWKAYPKEGRRAKPTALRRWKAAITKQDPERIIAAIQIYAEDPNRDPGHTKWMQGWLSEERWNDPPLPSRNGQTPFDRAVREAMADATD